MYSNWKKIIQIIEGSILIVSFASCKQSCFETITHNDVGYWSRYWTPSDPYGVITEYSKKDSIRKVLNEDLNNSFDGSLGAIYGVRFKFSNDTLFHYVRTKSGFVAMYDTIPIASYSRNKIVFKNGVVWHRIPKRVIKKKRKQLEKYNSAQTDTERRKFKQLYARDTTSVRSEYSDNLGLIGIVRTNKKCSKIEYHTKSGEIINCFANNIAYPGGSSSLRAYIYNNVKHEYGNSHRAMFFVLFNERMEIEEIRASNYPPSDVNYDYLHEYSELIMNTQNEWEKANHEKWNVAAFVLQIR